MRIEFDYEFDEHGNVAATHMVDSDDSRAMRAIAGLTDGTIQIAGSGWEVITKHPDYMGKTRLEAANAEMKRLGVTP